MWVHILHADNKKKERRMNHGVCMVHPFSSTQASDLVVLLYLRYSQERKERNKKTKKKKIERKTEKASRNHQHIIFTKSPAIWTLKIIKVSLERFHTMKTEVMIAWVQPYWLNTFFKADGARLFLKIIFSERLSGKKKK